MFVNTYVKEFQRYLGDNDLQVDRKKHGQMLREKIINAWFQTKSENWHRIWNAGGVAYTCPIPEHS
jgi:hypothetical protein